MENFEFEIAESFLNHTSTHIFLTGKAGTGKTTFLRETVARSKKKSVIVAPTGVAAINAGGVTIHSMFGLPTKSFIPSNAQVDPNLGNNKEMLSRHFHYHKDKLEVIQELELLVIDEVSMVRADILDAIDFSLRYVRRNNFPFGGVQVLFIGDMYQLPPVLKEEEWPLLSKFYTGPYFFDSLVFQEIDPVYIELRKIYRQSDNYFIRILNNIRNQDFQEEDYEALREHYQPEYEPDEPGYITLTTHNKKADAINEKELSRLPGSEIILQAEISGDFFDNMFPTEKSLRLKIGAQVMFVKNDTSGDRKYFNGKIGIIINSSESDGLEIRFPDSGEKIWVKQELWENIRYSMNEADNKLEQNRIGSFRQYPLRLAWAITIHKSQGLTFEKAVIDAGESFAPGQVYVALSRCTSMDHLVLKSLITGRNIFSDPRIVDFSHRTMKEMVLENRLVTDKRQYEIEKLNHLFQFEKLRNSVKKWDKNVTKIKSVDRNESYTRTLETLRQIDDLQLVADKFGTQVAALIRDKDGINHSLLDERLRKAIGYFTEKIHQNIILSWEQHFEEFRYKAKVKKYTRCIGEMVEILWQKMDALYSCTLEGVLIFPAENRLHPQANEGKPKKAGKPKGETFQDTLELHRQGKSIGEIAEIRNMAVSTIEGHISKWIGLREIQLNEVMDKDKIGSISDAIKILGVASLGALKNHLGDAISYTEIRWVIASGVKVSTV